MVSVTFTGSIKPRVLIVEDDQSIRETVTEALFAEGFEVLACANGREGLAALTSDNDPSTDLLILDLMLPGLSGLDLCRELRRLNDYTPILIISARDSETDRVLGLEVGADDYLVKPFGIRELVARSRALLRRTTTLSNTPTTQEVLRYLDISIFVRECRATKNDIEISLSPKEYKILELFVQAPKTVWSREKLLKKIWGIDFVGDTKTVDVHIRWLREKIEDEPSEPKYIKTVRGFGYRFG